MWHRGSLLTRAQINETLKRMPVLWTNCREVLLLKQTKRERRGNRRGDEAGAATNKVSVVLVSSVTVGKGHKPFWRGRNRDCDGDWIGKV